MKVIVRSGSNGRIIVGSGGQSLITFRDEGVALGTPGTVDEVDFTGTGVTASRSGDKVTVNVTGGGAGSPAVLVEGGTERKITDMTAITAESVDPSTDLITLVDTSDTTDAASGTNKKMTINEAKKLGVFKAGVFGSIQDKRIGTYWGGANLGTHVLTINRLTAFPLPPILDRVLVDKLGVEITTGSSGKIRIILYRASSEGVPDELVAESGELTITGTGVIEGFVGGAVSLPPGYYFLAYLTDTANTIRGWANNSNGGPYLGVPPTGGVTTHNGVFRTITYGAAPSPFGSITWSAGAFTSGLLLCRLL